MQVKHEGLTLGLIQKLQTGSRDGIQYGDNTSVNATFMRRIPDSTSWQLRAASYLQDNIEGAQREFSNGTEMTSLVALASLQGGHTVIDHLSPFYSVDHRDVTCTTIPACQADNSRHLKSASHYSFSLAVVKITFDNDLFSNEIMICCLLCALRQIC